MKNRSIPHVNTSLQSQTTSGSNLLQVDTANHILYIILFDGPIKRQVTQRTSPVNLHVLLATREATERAWVCDGTQHNMQIPNGSGPGAKESPILLAVGGCSVLKANCTTGVKDFHWPANGLLQTAVSLQVHLRINCVALLTYVGTNSMWRNSQQRELHRVWSQSFTACCNSVSHILENTFGYGPVVRLNSIMLQSTLDHSFNLKSSV